MGMITLKQTATPLQSPIVTTTFRMLHMPSIVHELVVKATPDRVFRTMATPEGLARWWTKASQGKPQEGAEYSLFFSPEFAWQGKVTRYQLIQHSSCR
jgi:uncharacterized protein YndB with AHSA1/START domain